MFKLVWSNAIYFVFIVKNNDAINFFCSSSLILGSTLSNKRSAINLWIYTPFHLHTTNTSDRERHILTMVLLEYYQWEIAYKNSNQRQEEET